MSIYFSFCVLVLLHVATCVLRVLSLDDYDHDNDHDPLTVGGGKVERPYIDHVREDDHDDFDLYDILALTLATVDYDFDKYTPEQKQMVLDLHQLYRMNTTGVFPQASDMMMYEYNNTLQLWAEQFTRHCVWKHDFHKDDNMTWLQGQNLYKGANHLLSRVFYAFYMEHIWWYHNNYTCWVPYSKYKCGHMTQMMWWNSSHLGTARRSYCYPLDAIMFFNTHYLRSGNKQNLGFYLYRVGWPCTRCQPGYLCACGKFCVPPRYCSAYDLDCECQLACKNCAVSDYKRCRCHCKKGWDWNDCSYPCQDLVTVHRFQGFACWMDSKLRCLYLPEEESYYYGCANYCGLCQKLDKKDAGYQGCCGNKMCEDYFALDENCECKLMCPSWKCLYPPSTTTTTIATTTAEATTTTTEAAARPSSDAVAVQPNLRGIAVLCLIYISRLALSPLEIHCKSEPRGCRQAPRPFGPR